MKPAEKVYALLEKIPRGKVMSYKSMGAALGLHPRAVAAALRSNKDPVGIPCYKVVHADGCVGGYSCEGGAALKKKLLEKEGIRIDDGKVDKIFLM